MGRWAHHPLLLKEMLSLNFEYLFVRENPFVYNSNTVKDTMGMVIGNDQQNRKNIDTVFYSDSVKVDKEEVKKSLVDHDGYDPAINVRKHRIKGKIEA